MFFMTDTASCFYLPKVYVVKVPDGYTVNGDYFQKPDKQTGVLSAFRGLTVVENSTVDFGESLSKALQDRFTDADEAEADRLSCYHVMSITWQMNIPSELDYAGSGGDSDSDDEGNLCDAMQARCGLKKTIKQKLSPMRRNSGA